MKPDQEATNRVREFRVKLGLTQSALGERAGTSQQQVARIERGAQQARLDLAHRLCAALGQPIELVFPGSAKVFRQMRSMSKAEIHDDTFNGGELSKQLANAGIDSDPRSWHLKIRLSNGTTHFFTTNSQDHRRIRSCLWSNDAQFFVFDSGDRRVMIKLDHIEYAHWLWEPTALNAYDETETDPEEELLSNRILAYTSSSSEPITFGADPDRDEEGEGFGQIGHIFRMGEILSTTEPRYQFIFEDEDGEEVFLSSLSLSLFSVPLWVVDENALEASFDEIRDEEQDAK